MTSGKRATILFLALVLVATLTLLGGCTSRDEASTDAFLKSSHQLRKLVPQETAITQSSWSAGYFLFVGGASGETTTFVKSEVLLAWQYEDGSYIISQLPLTKIRIRLDEKAEVPTIQFYQETRSNFRVNSHTLRERPEDVMTRYLAYAVINCHPNDWPQSVTLPLNK